MSTLPHVISRLAVARRLVRHAGVMAWSLRFMASLALVLGPPAARADISLADSPLFATITVPGNLALMLSVEWPTASTPAYPNTVAYSSASTYLGYFDPGKCYQYSYNSTTPSSSYFVPYSTTATRTCISTSTVPLWSGNWLNWAGMQSLDEFRWVLTGGTRVPAFDTASLTVLQKTYHNGMGTRNSIYPDKILASGTSGATPFGWSGVVTRIHGLGVQMYVTGNPYFSCNFSTNGSGTTTYSCDTQTAGTLSCTGTSASPSCTKSASSPAVSMSCTYTTVNTTYNSSCTSTLSDTQTCSASSTGTSVGCSVTSPVSDYNAQSTAGSTATSTATYRLYMQVKVCDSAVGVESNCTAYGSNYKPEGLLQKNASKLRYSAFGYLNDSNVQRDGGVLRARMKYVGPTQPVPGSTAITNSAAEWNATTGVMVTSPDSTDASATVTAASSAGFTIAVPNSGVINYLNRFGLTTQTYKSNDPVSELYYATQRYFRNQGNVPAYSSLTGAGSANALNTWVDGFPVITNWTDPILYSCQRNFILGIGDVNTHRDANLWGSTIRSTDEPTMPSELTNDPVNVKTATDMVGKLEGIANLGSYSSGRNNSYFVAGLAYDAHTNDIRTDLTGSQTISTYFVDVLEGQTYLPKNQFWLAAKYGGFTVPAGFSAYAASNGTGTIPTTAWYNTTDTLVNGGTTNSRPDNYFTGGQPDKVLSGLTNAFAKIVSEAGAANTTTLSFVSPNESSVGAMNYAAGYSPSTWTGSLVASTISYASDGTPSLTPVWDARDLLTATSASNRKIVTCCTSAGAGLAFTNAALSTAALSSRTYYSSFSNVPGVASGSQSAANFVAYLRGDRSNETANGGAFRTRTYLLGDIVNAKLTPVGPPNAAYYDAYNPGYSSFVRTYSSRTTVVYAGANDGMLHAFDGTTGQTNSGKELFAYIPSFAYGDSTTAATNGLASLGNPNFSHHFLVDATPAVFDVDFNRAGNVTATAATPGDWRSLLVGGLGKGGKGYYALDVTNPGAWTNETAMASKVLWEFTDSTMGYSYGTARLAKTAKYGWTLIFASGYNNSDGKGYFYFVNPKTGALLEKVATPSGTTAAPINLAHLTLFIPDQRDYTADAVYGADLRGNVWRLDLTGASGSYSTPTLIAQLTAPAPDSTGQPVTTPVRVMIEPSTAKRYLMVGTGRLLDDTDINSTQIQTFYAIVDGTAAAGRFYTASTLPAGISFPINRGQLNANADLAVGIGSSPSQVMGWYHDLGSNATTGVAERINVLPAANNGVVAVAVNLPNGNACSPAGSGYLFTVNYGTGQSVLTNNGNLLAQTALTSGVISDIAFKNVGGRVRVQAGRSTGGVESPPLPNPGSSTLNRVNWREVPTLN